MMDYGANVALDPVHTDTKKIIILGSRFISYVNALNVLLTFWGAFKKIASNSMFSIKKEKDDSMNPPLRVS